jgi:hypothetical protein
LVEKPHEFAPNDLLHFVELDEFAGDWARLGLDVEHDLWTLQLQIMADPQRAPVIPGTGGLRKLRFAPATWQRGKSGSIRVCYAHFQKYGIVLLVMAYAKGGKDSLTAREKHGIRTYLAKIEGWLKQRNDPRKADRNP